MSGWANSVSFDRPSNVIQSPDQTSLAGTSPEVDEDSPRKRKRSSLVNVSNGDDASLSSPTTSKPRHQPGVKRACNDCRQQKVCWRPAASHFCTHPRLVGPVNTTHELAIPIT